MDEKLVKEWIDKAYEVTAERIQMMGGTSFRQVFRTMPMYENDRKSHYMAYVCYFYGCFESIIITKFLDKYDRVPREYENPRIVELLSGKWSDLLEKIRETAEKNYDIDMSDASRNVGRGR